MSEIVDLYYLLPRIYREMDTDGTLKVFIGAFQSVLQSLHDDEERLRLIQDIGRTDQQYLKYIARSLGWQLRSTEESEQRAEVRRIVDYYDLKGTPYGIRLLARRHLGDVFSRLMEFYPGDSTSASNIIENYNSTDQTLRDLLDGKGDFLDKEWLQARQEQLDREYGFDVNNRLYSYFIRCDVTPNNYSPLFDKVSALLKDLQTMHPAGRFGYLYFVTSPMTNDDTQLGSDLMDDLVGGRRLNALWTLNSGKRLDTPTRPVDPSESWLLSKHPDTLDIGRNLDGSWHLDDTHSTVGVLVEIS